jgi:uncharacterized RDD family membrane protein YckC
MTTGAIENPDHHFWNNYLDAHPKETWPYFIIYAIWITWIAFQLIVTIVLTNFLIALVTQGYEDVMS